MKKVHPLHLFSVLLAAGYDVAYLDSDIERKKAAAILLEALHKTAGANGVVGGGGLTARAHRHHEVTIAVNPSSFSDVNGEWRHISETNIAVWI